MRRLTKTEREKLIVLALACATACGPDRRHHAPFLPDPAEATMFKLRRKGMVQALLPPEGARRQPTYRPTARGWRWFEDWLATS